MILLDNYNIYVTNLTYYSLFYACCAFGTMSHLGSSLGPRTYSHRRCQPNLHQDKAPAPGLLWFPEILFALRAQLSIISIANDFTQTNALISERTSQTISRCLFHGHHWLTRKDFFQVLHDATCNWDSPQSLAQKTNAVPLAWLQQRRQGPHIR